MQLHEKIAEKQDAIEKVSGVLEVLAVDIVAIEAHNNLLLGVLDLVPSAKVPITS